MKVSALFLFLALAACNSKQVIDDAQCSEEEQDMFLTCIESGCSATYSQDLSGTDACAIEGGGSVVSVEAGGECGFTASGACYVICDCPEGVSISADISGESAVSASETDSLSEIVFIITQNISDIESLIADISMSIEELKQKDSSTETKINDMEYLINEKISSIEESNRIEAELLRAQIDDLNTQIAGLNSQINSIRNNANNTDANVAALTNRVDIIENSVIEINDDIISLYDSVGLMISRYTVDCNKNNLGVYQDVVLGGSTLQNRHTCILVEDVDLTEMPTVSVFQDRISNTTEYVDCYNEYMYTGSPWVYCNWYYSMSFDEFKVGVFDGGHSPGSGQPDDTWLGPGPYIRYDSNGRYLYTSSHYGDPWTTTGTTPYIYHVTVIGTKEYYSPQ
jgi:hypothetical protein